MCIHPHANLAREKILDRKRTGKIAQRQIVVELHKQFCIRLGEKVLSGNLACPNGGERDRGLVAGTNQQLRSARSEEHTSELQSRLHLVCRLLLEKQKTAEPLE